MLDTLVELPYNLCKLMDKGCVMLTIIRGLPGSGKSTLAAELRSSQGLTHPVREADDYFMQDGVYVFDVAKLRQAHATCLQMCATDLMTGDHCAIVANTFTTGKELEPYLCLARQLQQRVAIVEATGSWPSVHDVPEDTLDRMRARWLSEDAVLDMVRRKFSDVRVKYVKHAS